MSYQNPWHMKMRDIYKKKQEEESKKLHHVKNVEDKLMNQTTYHKAPNMASAYKKVMNSNHKPNNGEIAYRQFTTSGYTPH